jgi:penicillin-binding protein 2
MRLTIKDHIRESRLFNERTVVAIVGIFLLVSVIIGQMVYLQIISHEHYATLAHDNRITIRAVPPTRGLIYDRNGVLLAQNLPSYSLEFTPERIPDIDSTIKELSAIIKITDQDIERFKKLLQAKRSFMSIPLRYQLNDDEVARFAVNRHRFPGVDIEARLIRNYPLGSLGVHTLGYVARINEDELKKVDPSNYSATRFIGKTGVERFYEDILHGHVGYNHIETNALGRTLRTVKRIPSTPGEDLYLTIDSRLQEIAEQALGKHRGAVVAIDPQNGDVLAFASMPGYDPNEFVTGIDVESYQALQKSKANPLFNRALRGQYPPGSTIKPFLGLAGLTYERAVAMKPVMCRGWFALEGEERHYRDWKRGGHGLTTLDKAITQSCDVFFYDLAFHLGIDRMHEFLSRFGFGMRTGIDLVGEPKALLPSREWKRQKHHQPWYPGETVIAGIGQGYMLATPLQLASATATLANRGIHMQPRLVFATKEADHDEINLIPPNNEDNVTLQRPSDWGTVIKAMKHVVHGLHGTAHHIGRHLPYSMAGKTGTAQVFGIKQDEEYDKENVAERLRDHSLFIAFAPTEKPRIAVAVVVENGGSGSAVAAPLARKVIDEYLLNDQS